VDEVELWKIGWALVDDRPERLLGVFFEPNIDPSPNVKKAFFLQYHGGKFPIAW
jgi:hypothetical protein